METPSAGNRRDSEGGELETDVPLSEQTRTRARGSAKGCHVVASAFSRMLLTLQCLECSNGPESVWRGGKIERVLTTFGAGRDVFNVRL